MEAPSTSATINPGVKVTDEFKREALRAEVRKLSRCDNNRFPGAQPVSFQKSDLDVVLSPKNEYLVCEKSDGVRYLLLWMGGCTYFIDRNFDFFETSNVFTKGILHLASPTTLLDGELVRDEVADPEYGTMGQSTFWIFDALYVRDQYVGALSLLNRLRTAYGAVTPDPAYAASVVALPEVQLRLKPMYAARKSTLHVWKHVIPTLTHGNDGLIFTKNEAVYKAGTCEDIVKWKPAEMNTVDFCVRSLWALDEGQRVTKRFAELYCTNRSVLERYDSVYISPEDQAVLETEVKFMAQNAASSNEGGGSRDLIVECKWDPLWCSYRPPESFSASAAESSRWEDWVQEPGGGWRVWRVRRDKRTANDKSTVINVVQSIKAGVSFEDIERKLSEG